MNLKQHLLPIKKQLKLVALMALVLSVVELINLLSLRSLTQLALIPREVTSLPFILIAPFIHNNLWHFISNIFPFSIMALLLLQHGKRAFYWVSFSSLLLVGVAVWFLARPVPHMGINGVVYAYLAYLLIAGILSRETRLVLISLVVGLFYGGMVFGVLPLNSFISWESNLFGFIIGSGCALVLARAAPKDITIEI